MGGITHCGGNGGLNDRMKKFKTAVEFWNNSFNINFFDIRKQMREISFDILSSQSVIRKIHLTKLNEYKDQIYAPMDDDDIFLISESEYQDCISCFNENCNLIITGYYNSNYDDSKKYTYKKNPRYNFPIDTNNFLFKNEEINKCTKWVDNHNTVHKLPYVKFKELKHIETSLHIVHPVSISLLVPNQNQSLYDTNWGIDCKKHRIVMDEIIYDYVNEVRYKQFLPQKFWTPLEKFKELFSKVKLK